MQLEGYDGIELLHRNARHELYRARRSSDGLEVVLKVPQPSERNATQLLHEFHLLQGLSIPGVPRAHGLLDERERPILVLEELGPLSLADWLPSQPRLEAGVFLKLAVSVVRLIERLHQHGVVHCDLTPSNLIFRRAELDDPEWDVALVDFGEAKRMPYAVQSHGSTGDVIGTLPYISPEQTGRIERPIDARSDLYVLGLHFYEWLTGRQPFGSQDANEIIHSHLARLPDAPEQVEPTVPPVLSSILLKLLAKMPEDRYQRAATLLADLEEAQQRWQAHGQIEPFELATLDRDQEPPVPDKLFGRQRELGQLQEALQGLFQKRPPQERLLLLVGPAGIGKTALTERFEAMATEAGASFLLGHFDGLSLNVPYASLLQSFRKYLRVQLRQEQEESPWRQRLLTLGEQGAALAGVLPELEQLFGLVPAQTELDPLQHAARFQNAFGALVAQCASRERPLLLCLEELHHADPASLALLRALLHAPKIKHFLVLATTQDEGLEGEHAFARWLRSLDVGHKALKLEPLSAQTLVAWCCSALRCSEEQATPLAQILQRKTAGNPFALQLFLQTLHQRRVLRFDDADKSWHWQLDEVEGVEATEDVIEWMARSLTQLKPGTQEVLQYAASIGNPFSFSLLEGVMELPREALTQALWEAIEAGHISPIRESSASHILPSPALLAGGSPSLDEESAAQGRFVFNHERIQKEAYASIAEEEKGKIHWSIGQRLLAHPSEEDQLFSLVEQLNLGIDAASAMTAEEVPDLDESIEQLRALNLEAGIKAKATSAYGPALRFFCQGIMLLPKEAWVHHYQEWFILHREAASSAFLSGDHDFAVALLESGLGHASSAADRAELLHTRILAATARGDSHEALRWGKEGLKLFDLEVPAADELKRALATEMSGVRLHLKSEGPEALLKAPTLTHGSAYACIKLLSAMANSAYFIHPDLLAWLIARMVLLSQQHGNTVYSPYAYAYYGLMLIERKEEFGLALGFGELAVGLLDALGDAGQKAKVLVLHGAHISPWNAPLREALPYLREAVEAGQLGGDMASSGMASAALASHLFFMGKPLDAVYKEAQKAHEFSRMTRRKELREMGRVQLEMLDALKARDDEAPLVLLEEGSSSPTLEFVQLVMQMRGALFLGQLELGKEASLRSQALLPKVGGLFHKVDQLFYALLIDAARCAHVMPVQRLDILTTLEQRLRQLETWAESCPANVRHKVLLLQAEIARLRRQHAIASELYEAAIEQAHSEGILHEEALIYELAGRYHHQRNHPRIAHHYLRMAQRLYAKWGSRAKVQQLEREMEAVLPSSTEQLPERPQFHQARTSSSGIFALEKQSTTGTSLDVLSVRKAGEALSSELVLDALLEQLLQVCLEAAGASRGVFLLEHSSHLEVRACGQLGPGGALQMSREDVALAAAAPLAVLEKTRTQSAPLVLEDATTHPSFSLDPYVQGREVLSVLCLPIVHQGQRLALLYLENELTSHAFPPHRLEMIQLLSSQIAISLQNSLLFERVRREVEERKEAQRALQEAKEQLEARVFQRTQQLQQANVQLALSNSALRDFAYITSHDLKEPLRGLSNFAQFLLEDYREKLDDEGQKMLQSMVRMTHHMSRQIDSLLRYSRVSHDAFEIKPTDLNALVQEILESFQVSLEEAQIELRIPQPLPIYPCDAAGAAEIFRNLIGNAIKYNDKPHKWIEIGYQRSATDPALVEFYVRDNGIGIPQKHLDSIFQIFKRLHKRDQFGGGTGAGLSIVKKCIERHQGQLHVTSTVGQGSTFTFSLQSQERP